HNTSTWRRLCGVVNGLSGSAAIIAEMSDGLANCFCGQPWLNPPVNPSEGQGLGGGCCANRSPQSNTTALHTATLNVFTMGRNSDPRTLYISPRTAASVRRREG